MTTTLDWLRQRISLVPDTDYEGTAQQIRTDAEFHSGNIWALAFAIVIASVGLNVNSTAVIIGAMLISPLMGPIVGAGFALATYDWALLRRSLFNLALASAIGLVASALYFAVSPLADAQSELLARTRPTIYDVVIATCGGGAGIVAASRLRNKGNVVPGVAIATALMPPLCTAGFGIAQGNPWFVLGALHLFLINALFICLATLAWVRLMRFAPVADPDTMHLRRVRNVIAVITLGISIPSVYTAWTVVQEARFLGAARRFVSENLARNNRMVIGLDLRYLGGHSVIGATLLGQPVGPDEVQALEQRLAEYGLADARLDLKQPDAGLAPAAQLTEAVRAGIIDDLYTRNEKALREREGRIRVLEDEVVRLKAGEYPVQDVAREIAALHPGLASLAIARDVPAQAADDAEAGPLMVVASWVRQPSPAERTRLEAFLATRLGARTVRLVDAPARRKP